MKIIETSAGLFLKQSGKLYVLDPANYAWMETPVITAKKAAELNDKAAQLEEKSSEETK